MSGGKKGSSRPKLHESKLVKKLVPDPSRTISLRPWEGLLGRGTKKGEWRLYLNPRLSRYLEISEDEIVHAESPDGPDGLTVVWLSNTPRKVTEASTGESDFLQGPVSTALLPRAMSNPVAGPSSEAYLAGWCVITEWTWSSCSKYMDSTCVQHASKSGEWGCGGGTGNYKEGDEVHVTDWKVCQPCTAVHCSSGADVAAKA